MARPVWEVRTGAEALERMVSLNAEYNPRIYPIYKALMSSRYADEAIAAAWDNRMESRRDAFRQLILWIERDGALDPAWDLDEATDTLWALTSIQVWEQLVCDRGWPREQYEKHLITILRHTFVATGD